MSMLATQGAEAEAAVVVETEGHDDRTAAWMLGIGVALLAVVVILSLIAPLITSSGPKEITAAGPLRPPGGAHLLGTDRNAIDVWSRLLGAARIDLGIAVIAVFFAVLVGTLIGVVVGFVGGWLEEGTMRLFDIIQAFPTFIFALTVAAVVGPGAVNLMIVIAAVIAPHSGSSTGMPRPRNDRPASVSIAHPQLSGASTRTGVRLFGTTWCHRIRQRGDPDTEAASMYGWARTVRTSARTSRA